MLPKLNRIVKKKDFDGIFKNSKSLKNDLLVLRAGKNSLDVARFGFIVSLKVSKKATVRNKIRRRLSAVAQAEIKNIKNGTDLILIALPRAANKDFSEIKAALKELLNKAKCLIQ